MNCGKIKEVFANMNMFESDGLMYDETTILNLKTENGLTGSIIQDVVTKPPQKNLRIQGSKGFIEWHVNYNADHDAVIYGGISNKSEKILIPKTRPDDFIGEINHIDELINNPSNHSPISLELGIDCMKVIKSAYESYRGKKLILIN